MGVPRHPLFFLGWFRKDKSKNKGAGAKGGSADESVTVGVCLPVCLPDTHLNAGALRSAAGWHLTALPCPLSRAISQRHTNHSHPLELRKLAPCRLLWRPRMCVRSGCAWRPCQLARAAPQSSSTTCTRHSPAQEATGALTWCRHGSCSWGWRPALWLGSQHLSIDAIS